MALCYSTDAVVSRQPMVFPNTAGRQPMEELDVHSETVDSKYSSKKPLYMSPGQNLHFFGDPYQEQSVPRYRRRSELSTFKKRQRAVGDIEAQFSEPSVDPVSITDQNTGILRAFGDLNPLEEFVVHLKTQPFSMGYNMGQSSDLSTSPELGRNPIYFRQVQPTAASRTISEEECNTSFENFWDQVWRDQVEGVAKAHHLRKDESINFLYKLKKKLRKEPHGLYFAKPVQVAALKALHHLGVPQTRGGIPQVQFQNNILGGDIEAQFSEPNVDPSSIPDPVGLSDRTAAEHNTGGLRDNIAENTGAPMSGGPQNIDPFSGFERPPPDGPEQNTGILRAFGDLILRPIQSNRIRQLVFVSGCNFVSNAMMGVNYLQNDLQGVHETFWKAQHIASFGVPIAVSVFTLLSSFWFASDPERWSNCITGLSSLNAGMTAGGPLAFYFTRNQGTKI